MLTDIFSTKWKHNLFSFKQKGYITVPSQSYHDFGVNHQYWTFQKFYGTGKITGQSSLSFDNLQKLDEKQEVVIISNFCNFNVQQSQNKIIIFAILCTESLQYWHKVQKYIKINLKKLRTNTHEKNNPSNQNL